MIRSHAIRQLATARPRGGHVPLLSRAFAHAPAQRAQRLVQRPPLRPVPGPVPRLVQRPVLERIPVRWSSTAASGSDTEASPGSSSSTSTSTSSPSSTSTSTSSPSPSSSSSSTSSEPETKTLLIVYHTLTNGTRQMAEAAAAAARAAAESHNSTLPSASSSTSSSTSSSSFSDHASPRINITLLRASDAGPADVLSADAYIFACPENLATMAGIMKYFFDRCYYPVLGRANGRAYALLICAGSDGEGAMRQIDRICTGWRLKKATEGIIVCTHAQTAERCLAQKVIGEEDRRRCAEVGEGMAEGLALGVF